MPQNIWENFVIHMLNISVQVAVIFCVLLLVRAVFSLCRVPKKYVCILWMILFVRLLMPVQPESPVGLWTKDSTLLSLVENPGGYSRGIAAEGNNIAPEELRETGSPDLSKEQHGAGSLDSLEELHGTGSLDSPEELQGAGDISTADEIYGAGSINTLNELYAAEGIYPPKDPEIGEDMQMAGRLYMQRKLLQVIYAVWGAGCLGLLLYGGISCLLLKKKLRCSIKRGNDCYLVDGIPTAFVMGFFPPKIYLPSEIREEDMDYVILHERIHIKRKDYLIKAAAYLITCFYWFHPFVWAALIFMSRDIELSCDEAVLRELGEGSRRVYADTLLRLSGGRRCFAGMPLAFGEGDTESRIRHIVRYRKPVAAAAVVAVFVIVVLTAGLLTSRPAEDGDGGENSGETLLGDSGDMAEHDPSNENVIQPLAGQGNDLKVTDQGDGRTDTSNAAGQGAGQESSPDAADRDPDSINSLFPEPVEVPSGHTVVIEGDGYNITVNIDGEAYSMAERCDLVNALMDVREFDKYIMVVGHINPDNSYYGFYNTESKKWSHELIGGALTWDENWETLENPIESVIYAESGDSQGVIRDWKANMIAVFDLKDEYIYGLRRVGDDITITIVDYEGKNRELSFDFKDSFYTLYHW